ncbi:MAG: hypothetical protein ACXW09_14010 [Methylococcaceae bacterium]
MNMKLITATTAVLLVFQLPSAAFEMTLQEQLFQRALQGTKCEQIPNNGRYCKYQFGTALEIGINDVGGTDTIVGFHNSNNKNELYAVLYFGCIAVAPGEAHPRNYNREYGVFISPVTGLVYQTSDECRATLKG